MILGGLDVPLTLSVIWLVLVIWLIVRAWRQRGALLRLQPSQIPADRKSPHVAIIIPARNERENIAPCLQSVLRQSYPPERLSIIVVDDESTDSTAAIVKEIARSQPRIILHSTPPLPPQWKGKVHACYTALQVLAASVEWVCFLDADMRAGKELIASALEAAINHELDLLSLAPRHKLISFAERLMIPCGLYLLSFSQRLERAQSPANDDAVANGQFMLFRRIAYNNVGGHSAVYAATCEDVEMARLIKRKGYRVLLMDGSQLLSARMYNGWRTLWPGVAKNLTQMLGGVPATVLTILLALALSWSAVLLPLIDFNGCAGGVSSDCVAIIPALIGSVGAFALHLVGATYFRIPLWYGMLFPLGYAIGAVLALDSLRWRLSGRIHWKGRVYNER